MMQSSGHSRRGAVACALEWLLAATTATAAAFVLVGLTALQAADVAPAPAPAPAVQPSLPPAVGNDPAADNGVISTGDPYSPFELYDDWPPLSTEPSTEGTGASPATTATLRQRVEDPQSVPATATVLAAATLQDAGIQSIRDAAFTRPGLLVPELSPRTDSARVFRGISGGSLNPAATTFVDGVPQVSPASANLALYDLDRIELLAGPQGTLYGRNTLGGVVKVQSAEPSLTTLHAGVSTGFGNYKAADFHFDVNGPVQAERLALGFSGGSSERDGYSRNLAVEHDTDTRQALFGRAQALFETGDFRARFILTGERDRDGDNAYTDLATLQKNPHRSSHDYQGHAQRDVVSPTLLLEADTATTHITSVTGVVWWQTTERTDLDATATNLAVRGNTEQSAQFTQEFRFQSLKPVVRSARLAVNWLAGLSFLHALHSQDQTDSFSAAGAATQAVGFPFQDVTQVRRRDIAGGAFGHVNATWNEHLHVSFGLRFDYEHKHAQFNTFTAPATGLARSGGSFSDDFVEVTPQFSLDYQFTPDLMAYGAFANGYKSGGFNTTAPTGREAFQTEQTWSYELGLKSQWFSRRLTLNLSAYYTDWFDIQLPVTNPSATSLTFLDATGRAVTNGLEFTANAELLPGWTLFTGGSLADTRFLAGSQALGSSVGHKHLPYAPGYTASLGTQFTQALNTDVQSFLQIETQFIGRYFYDPNNAAEQADFNVINLRAGLTGRNWRLELYAKNLLDANYIPAAFRLNPIATSSGFVGESGDPVTYGGRLELHL